MTSRTKKASIRFKIGTYETCVEWLRLLACICLMTVAIFLTDFYQLSCRVTQIKTYSWDNAQVILVGNKCDMEDERVISFERGKQLADQLGVEFFETSAKENINVKVSQMLLIGYNHNI